MRDGALQRVDAPEGTFRRATDGNWEEAARAAPRLQGGEGTALRVYQVDGGGDRALGAAPDGAAVRADKHLPDIAGLIDPDQFELITKPSSGLVVVRGTAGSGKTTVALHRIAYLAYADPEIDSERTLVVVFSRALRDYVSHVLPALGIQRARVSTFHDWAREQRRRHFPMLARETRDDAPAVVQRLKAHPVMLEILATQVERHGGRSSARQALDDWGSALGDAALLAEVVERAAPGAFSREELERAATWCGRRYRDLLAHLAGEDPNPVEISPEDDALLLRAYQLRVGRLRNSGGPLELRHVAIDEVQDFSPLEVRVLIDCLDEHRSMTLAGDTQQHVLQDAGFSSWNDFFRHLGLAGTEVETLRVAYRSTHEIVQFALAVLGGLREDDAPPMTTRSGPPVELFRFTDHGAAVALLAAALKRLAAREPLASVVLLAPSAEIAGLYHRAPRDGGGAAPRLGTGSALLLRAGRRGRRGRRREGPRVRLCRPARGQHRAVPGHAVGTTAPARRRDPRHPPALADQRRDAVAAAAGSGDGRVNGVAVTGSRSALSRSGRAIGMLRNRARAHRRTLREDVA